MQARLHLDFCVAGGQTRLHCPQQDPPWKVVRAFPNPSGESLVHLNNVSGGVFGGDRLCLQIDLAPGAAAQITTTGSTRVYRPANDAADALQISDIHVGEGALLEYLPDSIIPFGEARFEQRTHVHLEAGATLFWWDILAPGRVASGELFAYNSVRLNTRICSRGEPIYIDRMHLYPQQADLSSLARFGKFGYLTSFMICHSGADPSTWIALEQKLRGIAEQRSHLGSLWGASTLAADGMLVRGLSESGLHLLEDLFCFWSAAKSFLCGGVASPPRRMY